VMVIISININKMNIKKDHDIDVFGTSRKMGSGYKQI